MACPLCGERCTCSYAPPRAGREQERAATSVLIHSDSYDFSEQQFEASLAAPAVRQEMQARRLQHEEAWNLVASVAPLRAAAETVSQQEGPDPVEQTPYWREEVTSRVESYRAKRKRPPRHGSLSLDFERAVNRQSSALSHQSSGQETVEKNEVPVASDEYAAGEAAAPATNPYEFAPGFEEFSLGAVPPAPEPAGEPPQAEERPLTAEDSNLIVFPRTALPPVMPPTSEEVAETLIGKPRILEAPEAVETARAPLAGIQLAAEESTPPAVEFELPMYVAAMSHRLFAGMLDVLIVTVGAMLFLMVVTGVGASIPTGKSGTALMAAAAVVFWAVYEYLFLVYAGKTPGMQIARLSLLSFEGKPVSRRARRGRALAMVPSYCSLGLGLFWALLDEDTLCWHDRISRTYVTNGWE